MERRTSFSKRIFSIMLSLLMVLSMMLHFPSGIFSNISFGLKASAAELTPTEPSTDNKGVYQIGTAEELYWFANYVNSGNTSANAVLTADITVNQNVLNENGELNSGDFISWTPIGKNISISYNGTFDGQNHTVSGLYFNSSSTNYVGLFGKVESGSSVSNVGVVDSYFKGKFYVGGVCGQNLGTITNCYNTGKVSGYQEVGGVCGENNAGYIANCYNTGAVSVNTSLVGGVCGYNYYGTITNCYNTGEVSGNSDVGGVCGANRDGTVTNCYYLETSADGGIKGVDAEGLAESKTAAQFNSGEVAYLLSQGENGSVWGQTIGTDSLPVIGGAVVYQVNVYAGCEGNSGDPSTGFSNTNASVYAEHIYDTNGFCTFCGKYEPAEQNSKGEYEIGNTGQLYWFADKVNNDYANYKSANAVLTADITVNSNLLGSLTFDSDGNVSNGGSFTSWTPIGNWDAQYTGIFDGRNHTVSGLYFNDPSIGYVGLFGSLAENGEIRNIGVIDSYLSGEHRISGVCGDNNGTITNCYNTGKISGEHRISGVCGENMGTITNCYNTGAISGEHRISGVCGSNFNGEITNCYNTGAVSGDYFVGGVCGDYFNGEITNCYYIDTTTSDSNAVSKTERQFASGEVAFLLSQGCTVGDTTYDGSVWGQDLSTADSYPVLDSTKTVYRNETYAGCEDNKGDVTYSYSNTEEAPIYADHNYSNGICTICGEYQPAEQNTDGYYEIANAGQLYWFANYVNSGNTSANAVLTADITVNQNVLNENGELNSGDFISWTPIGNSYGGRYTGTFDGKGNTIIGLYFNDKTKSDVGLFGYNNGTVKNVGVVDSYFNGSDGVGSLCGSNDGTITNCYNSGRVSGATRVGGLCGWSDGKIENCYNTGVVSGTNYVGGVCGNNVKGTITNCYNTGSVRGTNSIGGVCGENYTENISSIITNCYNTGVVSGTGDYVGGVCGKNVKCTISNCYYLEDTAIDAIGNNSGTSDKVEVKTKDEFNSGEVAYLLSQGCTVGETIYDGSVWGQTIGTEDYPVLGGDKVYYGYVNCDESEEKIYSNTALTDPRPDHNYPNGICTVCGKYEPAEQNSKGEYEIGNAGQLYWFADKVNNDNANYGSANAILTSDITVNGNVLNKNCELNDGNFKSWTPIGKNINISYNGTFDGQNHTVSGLYLNNNTTHNAGLFGFMSGGKISNVGIVDSYIHGGDQTGGICGYNASGTITNCYSKGVIKGSNNIGGICGYQSYGEITNCYSTGSVSGTSKVGSICGYAVSGTITNCYYLAETEDENGGKTETQFGSGEVAYLLSQGENGEIWGQTIGTDSMPVMGGKKVLANIDKSAFANDIIIYGQSASLDGTIGFNVYVSADDSYEWNTTIGGVTGVKNKDGLYVFTYNVAAKDMDESINFTVNDKIDVTVSVSKYLDELSETDNESLKNLAESMSAYGDAAKAFFSNGTVAEQTITDDLSVYDFTVAMPEGISYYGSSLILESETTIRHYFKLEEGQNIANFAFTVDGESVEPVAKQGYYYIDIQNISAEMLGTAFSVSVNGEDVITNYSALSYVNKVLDSDSTDDNLKNLVKALYIYNQNALAYNPA